MARPSQLNASVRQTYQLMSYTVRIARGSAITLKEWELAISARSDVRLQQARTSVTNPVTREVITFGFASGDAEVSDGGQWWPCFRWRRSGQVAFEAPSDWAQPNSSLRCLVRCLARHLEARVVGEGGEEYD